MALFVIEDEAHAEWNGEFHTLGEALEELMMRSKVPWDQEPNRTPCQSWATCGRDYVVIEFDDQVEPWREVRRTSVLKVGPGGAAWNTAALPSGYQLRGN